jgi:hypothetical protein
VLALPLLILLTTLGATDPAGANEALVKAEHAFEDLEFDQAARHFKEALSQPGSREERLRAYRGLGMCEAYLGNPRAAQAAFETLLLMDPQAKVNAALGPKVAKPFAAARRATRGKGVELRLHRDGETGRLAAELSRPVDAVAQVVLHVRSVDAAPMKAASDPSGPATLDVAPWREVTAWASAEDPGGGALFIAGSPDAPLRFPATARPPPAAQVPAVAAVVEDARTERPSPGTERSPAVAWSADDEVRPKRWPLWVGGAVVLIGGGVAAAYALRPGEPLQLPAATRTGRLP